MKITSFWTGNDLGVGGERIMGVLGKGPQHRAPTRRLRRTSRAFGAPISAGRIPAKKSVFLGSVLR